MAKIISMVEWREAKKSVLGAIQPLECPQCEAATPAIGVKGDGTTTYRCSGHGHRALTWRIDSNGDMLRSAVGHRYY